MDSVTQTTIMDMIVELDDATREAVNFKDLRRGMRAWIKERRVRLRYCLKVEEMLLEEANKTGPAESFASITSDGGEKKKTKFLKDVTEENLEKYPPHQRQIMRNNIQPIMPPDDIGTEVCDQPGHTCKWQAVFPEKLILAWRIQKKLEELYDNKRWKDIKHALKLFGHLRSTDHELLEEANLIPEPSPEPALSSHEKLVRLAQKARSPKQIEHEAKLRRFSLHGERKEFAVRTGGMPRRAVRYSENDADIAIAHSQYFFDPNDPLTKQLESDLQSVTVPTANAIAPLPDAPPTVEKQMNELRAIRGHMNLIRDHDKAMDELIPDDSLNVMPIAPKIMQSHVIEGAKTLVPSKEFAQMKKTAQQNFEKMAEKDRKHTASEEMLAKGIARKVSTTGHHGDRSSYEKFLRKRFREIHNVWLIEAEPTDILETLQLRAVKMLEKAVQQEEDRERAAMDPSRKNESTRELIAEFAGIVQETKHGFHAVPVAPIEPPALDAERKRHNEIKTMLLENSRGLFTKDNKCFMDHRSRSILNLARQLKSQLCLEEGDPRRLRHRVPSKVCSEPVVTVSVSGVSPTSHASGVSRMDSGYSDMSGGGPSRHSRTPNLLAPPKPHRHKHHEGPSKSPVWIESEHLTVRHTPSTTSSAHKVGTPEVTDTHLMFSEMWQHVKPKTPTKEPSLRKEESALVYHDSDESIRRQAQAEYLARSNAPRRRINRMMAQVTLVLESFLSEKRDHLMRGLNRQIKKQARAMNIAKYQNVEVVERRLVQTERMRKLDESYQGSIRRAMWTDFRQIIKSNRHRDAWHLLPEDKLRAALLRHEDVDHKVETHRDAMKHYEALLEKAYGGPILERRHRKWFRRFTSLPAFFPLNDDLDLMKTMQAFETVDIA